LLNPLAIATATPVELIPGAPTPGRLYVNRRSVTPALLTYKLSLPLSKVNTLLPLTAEVVDA
jgi:hypothetical protein